jgi:quercetin dioxygenase-like cupin family protein
MDNVVGTGFSGPPHHHDFDEIFYVLEGELTFQLEDELFTRKRGVITKIDTKESKYRRAA